MMVELLRRSAHAPASSNSSGWRGPGASLRCAAAPLSLIQSCPCVAYSGGSTAHDDQDQDEPLITPECREVPRPRNSGLVAVLGSPLRPTSLRHEGWE